MQKIFVYEVKEITENDSITIYKTKEVFENYRTMK